jgi:putative membrane protein
MTTSQPAPAPAPVRAGSPGFRAGVALAVTVALTAAAMLLMGDAAYPWVKSVHVMAIIAWMAGMLYLPRLFVYHADAAPGSDTARLFKVMEHRLMTIIMNPAMVIAWVLGLWLAWRAGFLLSGWFLGKLLLVLALSGVHGYLSAAVRKFAEDRNTVPSRTWRMLNEVPALLMVGIVILVIVKPF